MQALLDAIAAMPLPHSACRIFHGRGGRYPGCTQWTLDAYPPAFVLTSFAPVQEAEWAAIGHALRARWAQLAPGEPLAWVFQQRGEALRTEGRSDTQLMAGHLPEPHVVREGGERYRVQLLRGQNHGLFLDMAEGRRWVAQEVAAQRARLGRGPRVLNLFAYSGAFSVVALRAGAQEVVNVDMARGALALAQENHRLNGVQAGARFWAHDIFNSWGKIGRSGPYDLVIVDPPSYQKGSFVATKDWPRVLRRLPELLAPQAPALLCLNAPELGSDFLRAQVLQHAPQLAFERRLPLSPGFEDVDEERALKVLVYRRSAGESVPAASAPPPAGDPKWPPA